LGLRRNKQNCGREEGSFEAVRGKFQKKTADTKASKACSSPKGGRLAWAR
jgi:hypothetical protein